MKINSDRYSSKNAISLFSEETCMKTKLVWVFNLVLCLTFARNDQTYAQPQVEVLNMVFSYDGGRIAVTMSDALRIYDSNFNLVAERLHPSPDILYVNSWSHDGNQLIGGNTIYDANTLQSVRTIPDIFGAAGWGGNGASILANRDLETFVILDAQTNQVLETIPTPPADFYLWSPDQQYLATPNGEGITIVRATNQATVTRYPLNAATSFSAFAWSEDSRYILVSVVVDVPVGTPGSFTTTANESLPLLDPTPPSITNTPSTAKMNALYVVDIGDGNITQTIQPFVDQPRRLYVRGQWVIAISNNNGVSAWDLTTGVVTDQFTLNMDIGVHSVSPLGGRLVFNPNPTRAIQPANSTTTRWIISDNTGALNVILPITAPQKISEILDQCNLTVRVEQSTELLVDRQQWSELVNQVSRLNTTQDNEGCLADVVSIANTIQNSSLVMPTPTP
jgi:hypothetical protein